MQCSCFLHQLPQLPQLNNKRYIDILISGLHNLYILHIKELKSLAVIAEYAVNHMQVRVPVPQPLKKPCGKAKIAVKGGGQP